MHPPGSVSDNQILVNINQNPVKGVSNTNDLARGLDNHPDERHRFARTLSEQTSIKVMTNVRRGAFSMVGARFEIRLPKDLAAAIDACA